jgi:hypothetical protein
VFWVWAWGAEELLHLGHPGGKSRPSQAAAHSVRTHGGEMSGTAGDREVRDRAVHSTSPSDRLGSTG